MDSIRANDTRNLQIQIILGSSYSVDATLCKSYLHEVGNPTFALRQVSRFGASDLLSHAVRPHTSSKLFLDPPCYLEGSEGD